MGYVPEKLKHRIDTPTAISMDSSCLFKPHSLQINYRDERSLNLDVEC